MNDFEVNLFSQVVTLQICKMAPIPLFDTSLSFFCFASSLMSSLTGDNDLSGCSCAYRMETIL